jgi:HPt (histidine-containing phosphotransfer) domain-containing protein
MTGDSKPFDLSYLLQVFQGNKTLVIEIVELFLQQVPEYVRLMELHVKEGNHAAIHPLAHKSKSSTSMLGLKSIESLLLEIELNGKAGNYENLPAKVHALSEQISHCAMELRAYLDSQQK